MSCNTKPEKAIIKTGIHNNGSMELWKHDVMHSSTNVKPPPNAVDFLWSCDKVYHKQEVGLPLYLLGQLGT